MMSAFKMKEPGMCLLDNWLSGLHLFAIFI